MQTAGQTTKSPHRLEHGDVAFDPLQPSQSADLLRVAMEQTDYMPALVNDTLELARLEFVHGPTSVDFSPDALINSCTTAFTSLEHAR